MHIFTIVSLLFGLIAALPAPQMLEAPAGRHRATSALMCDGDDLVQKLRDFQDPSRASTFCSSFMQPNVTVPGSTFALKPPTSPAVAKTKVLTSFAADMVEDRTASSTLTVTSLATPSSTPAARRDNGAPYPAWLPTTYEVSRVSSACSCIISNAPPTSTHDAQATESSDSATVATTTAEPSSTTTTISSPTSLTTTTTATAPPSLPGIPVTRIYCSVHGLANPNTTIIQRISGLTHLQCHDGCHANPRCLSTAFLGYGLTQCLFATGDVKSVYKEGSLGAEWVLDDRECPFGDVQE